VLGKERVFHVKHEGWGSVARVLGLSLDGDQARGLDSYVTLLRERAIPLGIVSVADREHLKDRHVRDCLRAAAVVLPSDVSAYDLGSGAGLPGIPVAIACPWLQVNLVESRRSRVGFLELVVEHLQLENARVLAVRIEALRERVSLCFARALASPSLSWKTAEPLLLPRGRLAYFAGSGFEPSELPRGVAANVISPVRLARSGPLVIMART